MNTAFIGRLAFANRECQLQFVDEVKLTNGHNSPVACVINAPADSGISRFLNEACNRSRENSISIEINGANGVAGNAFAQIVLDLYSNYPSHYRDLLALSKKKFGHHWVLESIPYLAGLVPIVGGPAQAALQKPIDEYKQEMAQFPSLMAGLICEFLANLSREERVNLFIDDAQELDEWSREMLTVTRASSYSHLRFFLGNTHRQNTLNSSSRTIVFDDLIANGYPTRILEFSRPDVDFITALIKCVGVEASLLTISKIERSCAGRMRKIIGAVRNLIGGHSEHQSPNGSESFSPVQSEIISFLCKAGQSLRISDIGQLCAASPDIFVENLHEVDAAILNLETREMIKVIPLPGGDQLIELESISHEYVHELRENRVRQMRAGEKIYQYVKQQLKLKSPNHAETELIPLAYRLAKEFDTQQLQSHARKMVQLGLGTGSLENAQRFIDEAIPSKGSYDHEDVVVKSGLLMAMRKYHEALHVLEQRAPATDREDLHLRILKAVCLNRVRRHIEANTEIDKLMTRNLQTPTRLTLAALKISGCIHENEIEEAQQIFRSMQDEYSSHRTFGYFARNASAALSHKDAVQMLKEVISDFGTDSDSFGLASAENNLAARYLEEKLPDKATSLLENSKKRMEVFGLSHLHIVENNKGLCSCLEKQPQDALKSLKKAILCSNSAMPNLYIHLNTALCYYMSNSENEMLVELAKAESLIQSEECFSRMKQKYYINAAILLAGIGVQRDRWSILIKQSRLHPDRSTPELTENAARAIEGLGPRARLSMELVLKLFSPCTLEYWYFNPMELIADEMLPSDTKSNYVL